MLKKYKRILRIMFVMLLFLSCQKEKIDKKKTSKNEDKLNIEWIGKNVFFPESLKSLSKEKLPHKKKKSKFTIVIYYDGGCAICYFQLKKWFGIMKHFSVFHDTSYKFILSGNNHVYLENNLKVIKFPLKDVQHDEKVEFANKYRFLLAPNYLNSAMLLDKDNKILFIGNPTISKVVEEKYFKLMSTK